MVYCNGVHIPFLFLLIAIYNFLTCIRFSIELFCISLSLSSFLSGFEIIFTVFLGLWRYFFLHLSEQSFMLGCDLPSESTFIKFFEHITQLVLMFNYAWRVIIYLTTPQFYPAKMRIALYTANYINYLCGMDTHNFYPYIFLCC